MATAALTDRQLDRLEAVEAKLVASADWTQDPVAKALIASCVKRPPQRAHNFASYAITRDEWSEYTGNRVRALNHVRDRYAATLLPACDEQYRRTGDHFAYAPMDQHRINTVEAVLSAATSGSRIDFMGKAA